MKASELRGKSAAELTKELEELLRAQFFSAYVGLLRSS